MAKSSFSSTLSQAFDNLEIKDIEIYGDFDYNKKLEPQIVKTIPKKIQQKAAINELYLAGYFNQKYIWNVVHTLGKFENPIKAYEHIVEVFTKAGAYEGKLNEQYVIDNLLNGTSFSVQDAEDFLVYLMQTAFDRSEKAKQYLDLENKPWMIQHKEQIEENAKNLGMIDPMYPSRKKYHETWILGAHRGFIEQRLNFVKANIEKGLEPGKIRLLTGERDLQTVLDDKDYMVQLATKMKVQLNETVPFTKEGKYNYQDPKQQITETDMGEDLVKSEPFKEIFDVNSKYPIKVIHTPAKQGYRATTETTALTAFDQLALEINQKPLKDEPEIFINVVANQIMNLRQHSTIIGALLKSKKLDALKDKKIIFFISGDKVPQADRDRYKGSLYGIIHSQIGALFFDKYEIMLSRTNEQRKRKVEQIKCETRGKIEEKIEIPSYEEYKKQKVSSLVTRIETPEEQQQMEISK